MGKKLINRKKLNPNIHVFTGVKYSDKIKLQLFEYNSSELMEKKKFLEKEFHGFTDNEFYYWLNLHGIHDVERIQELCSKLDVHSLAVQDILDVNQRPKFQDYDNYWFFSVKSILPSKNDELETEQISFVLGKNYLVSFQEKMGDHFDHVRQRLREKVGLIRERSTDFLLYLLLESIFDNYFKTIEAIELKLDEYIAIDIREDPSPAILKTIENYRRQVHQIKKIMVPTKEFIVRVDLEEEGFIDSRHFKYYFELKDMCLSIIDDCDKLHARLDSQENLFFSVQGHRMNQVMKTLTVVATIFIPLTFVAGVYGMNFSYMPELGWKWGYFAVWGVMLAMLLVMLYYFKKKKWF